MKIGGLRATKCLTSVKVLLPPWGKIRIFFFLKDGLLRLSAFDVCVYVSIYIINSNYIFKLTLKILGTYTYCKKSMKHRKA